jgi:hypothetical protein
MSLPSRPVRRRPRSRFPSGNSIHHLGAHPFPSGAVRRRSFADRFAVARGHRQGDRLPEGEDSPDDGPHGQHRGEWDESPLQRSRRRRSPIDACRGPPRARSSDPRPAATKLASHTFPFAGEPGPPTSSGRQRAHAPRPSRAAGGCCRWAEWRGREAPSGRFLPAETANQAAVREGARRGIEWQDETKCHSLGDAGQFSAPSVGEAFLALADAPPAAARAHPRWPWSGVLSDAALVAMGPARRP